MSKAVFQGLFTSERDDKWSMVMPVKKLIQDLAGYVWDNKQPPSVDITVATTLTADHSNKLLVLKGATAGAAITLPAVATSAGIRYRFVVGAAFANTAWTVVAATAKIQGGAIVNSVWVPAADENTITFAHAAETVGDWLTLDCDGTNWYANGVAAVAGGITFTAV